MKVRIFEPIKDPLLLLHKTLFIIKTDKGQQDNKRGELILSAHVNYFPWKAKLITPQIVMG